MEAGRSRLRPAVRRGYAERVACPPTRAEAGKAHAYVKSNANVGKVVLRVAE